MSVQYIMLSQFSLSLFHMLAGVCMTVLRLMSVTIYSPTKIRTYTHEDDITMF